MLQFIVTSSATIVLTTILLSVYIQWLYNDGLSLPFG